MQKEKNAGGGIMATLKEVAKRAGVSTATVSCCLSGARNVRAETKLRVQQAIEDLKYIPNAAARSLKKMQTNKLGVILPDLSDHFFSEILRGLSQRLQEENYLLTMALSYWSPKRECELIDTFLNENVAGLLLVSCQPENTAFFRSRQTYGVPMVFLHFRPHGIEAGFVEMDTYTTTKALTAELLRKGYRDLVLITGERRFSAEQTCCSAVQDAYAAAGLPYARERRYVTNMSKEHAFRAAMQACGERVPDAFFCTSGSMARGVCEALSVQNLRVPEDVLVAALGEDSWNKSGRLPGVLSSARAAEQMGVQTAELLLRQLTLGHLPPKAYLALPDRMQLSKNSIPPRSAHIARAEGKPERRLRLLCLDTPSVHALQMLSRAFTAESGIRLELTLFDGLQMQKAPAMIRADCMAQQPEYDLMMFDAPWSAELIRNRMLADLTPMLRRSGADTNRIFKDCWDTVCDGDACYGIPFISGTQLLFYRRDLFEKPEVIRAYRDFCGATLRPPKTWQEFNRIACFFTKSVNPASPTEYGTAMPGCHDSYMAPEIMVRLWAAGAKLWDENGMPCMDLKQNERAYQLVLDSVQWGKQSLFDLDGEGVIEAFCQGEAAMILSFSEFAGHIRDSVNQRLIASIGYSTLPCNIRLRAGWSIGMNPHAKDLEAVGSFFAWLMRDDISCYYTILGGQSTVKSVYQNSEIIGLYPWMTMTRQQPARSFARCGPPPQNGVLVPTEQVEHVICDVVRNVVQGGKSLPQSLRIGQERMQQLFAAHGYLL